MATLSTIEALLRCYHTLGVRSDLRNLPQRSSATAWCVSFAGLFWQGELHLLDLADLFWGQGVLHFLDCLRKSQGALRFLDCKRRLLRWFILGPRHTAPLRAASAVLAVFSGAELHFPPSLDSCGAKAHCTFSTAKVSLMTKLTRNLSHRR